MSRTWRDRARPIIQEVLKENRNMPEHIIKKALLEAYPFGERAYHPYKIWLDEIKLQRGLKKKAFRQKDDHSNNLKLF